MTPKNVALACATMALSLLGTVAHANIDQTTSATFFPAFSQGELIGCQVSFSILRSDHEFSSGQPTRVNGLLVVYGPRAGRMGAMLRLGVSRAGADDFRPPARAFLLAGFTSNANDAGEAFQSDTPGFNVFPYAMGEATAEAIFTLAMNGRLNMLYGMPRTTVDARVQIDIREFPDVLLQWGNCLSVAMRE